MSHETAVKEKIAYLQSELLIARVYDAAQAVVDQKRPGEKVQEVLINTDSATSLAEKFANINEVVEKADAIVNEKQPPLASTTIDHEKGTVTHTPVSAFKYYVMFLSRTNKKDTWPTIKIEQNEFDTATEAFAALREMIADDERARDHYYVLASTSPAGVPDLGLEA